MWPWPLSTMKNSSQLWCRWFSCRAPGFRTVQPTTWSAPADFLSIRNCTCMSTQPSLRLRPPTFGTSCRLVRYILAGFFAADLGAARFFAALARVRLFAALAPELFFAALTRELLALPVAVFTIVLPAGDRLHVRRRNRGGRFRARDMHSSFRFRLPRAAPGCRACGRVRAPAACLSAAM